MAALEKSRSAIKSSISNTLAQGLYWGRALLRGRSAGDSCVRAKSPYRRCHPAASAGPAVRCKDRSEEAFSSRATVVDGFRNRRRHGSTLGESSDGSLRPTAGRRQSLTCGRGFVAAATLSRPVVSSTRAIRDSTHCSVTPRSAAASAVLACASSRTLRQLGTIREANPWPLSRSRALKPSAGPAKA